ncbi:DUF4132 domain-containing protein [Streptomyces uncialis]|uniref:DUF4132 domain-containing protein n=1 Tax=Streptomyces uncialis TaxID=1048205 RepID=UPI0037F11466
MSVETESGEATTGRARAAPGELSEWPQAVRDRRLAELSRPLGVGDYRKVVDQMLRIAATSHLGNPSFVRQMAAFTGVPEDRRRGVLAELVHRWQQDDDPPGVRVRLLPLVAMAGQGLPDVPLAEERAQCLAAMGGSHDFWFGDGYDALARAELDAGRALDPAVIATIRRSAVTAPAASSSSAPENLGALRAALTEPVLNVGEQWAERAMADGRIDVRPLLAHALTATASKPSARWEKAARAAVAEAGDPAAVRECVLDWLALVGRPRTFPLEPGLFDLDVNELFDPFNADALRGLLWTLPLLPPSPEVPRTLGALVTTALRKAPGTGPRSPRTANAAIGALARTDGELALAELARLGARVVHKPTAKVLDKALETRAAALGLSREEVEETAVPAHGLTSVGHAAHRFGEVSADLRVEGTRARLTWTNAAGRQVRGVPAAVRRGHPRELKELTAAVKDIDRTLGAQSERLDRQFLARRVWPYACWRERYPDHPLVGTLARRLIWTVDGVPVLYADDAPRTVTGEPVPCAPDSEVRLWHPVGRPAGEITAWRERLEQLAVTQPFKQAHREVYPLTDAERTTGVYSNRFAGHILRQHQFHSLAGVRGWQGRLRLCVDDMLPPPVRELPEWGLRAEYWVEGDGGTIGVDTTEAGSFLRLRTDQVRFYPLDAPVNEAHCAGGAYTMRVRDGAAPVEPVPLAEVPELVLSEVLRDVDLFVGVASVGNDPTWSDGGPGGRFREYWTSYGFGELGPGAGTRRALLERLVPRLAIASRCTLEGRFLHVRGELRTYKIHLGSGNILMTPNDQYLCIVPAGPALDPGYLPFEGDRVLSLILSKAALLADDTAITDPTIVSQLTHH